MNIFKTIVKLLVKNTFTDLETSYNKKIINWLINKILLKRKQVLVVINTLIKLN